MNKKIQEIQYANENIKGSHFDLVKYEDILEKIVVGHNQFENHKLSFYALLLITEGSGKHNINFTEYNFKKGSIFTIRKDNIHKFYRTKAKGLLFVFTEIFISHQLSKTESSKIFLLFNELLLSQKLQLDSGAHKEILSLTKLIENEYYKFGDSYSPFIIRNLLLSISTKILRIKLQKNQYSEKNKYFSKFLDFQKLVENNCFKNRKVKFYADQMNVTPKTLSNISQSITHKTAKVFINDVVIIHTKRLIINSQKTLTEISYEVGFDEPTNFFKYFLKYAGLTPKQFREIQ